MKADPLRFFAAPQMGMGYWTRSNAEFVLLATRGKPKRLHANVSQIVIEPRRQHSRKPDLYGRIERLVAGPYVELFARQTRPGWDCWGDQTTCSMNRTRQRRKTLRMIFFRGNRGKSEMMTRPGLPFDHDKYTHISLSDYSAGMEAP